MLRDLMHCKLVSLFLDTFFNKIQGQQEPARLLWVPLFSVVGSQSRQQRKQRDRHLMMPIFLKHTFDCFCVSGSTPSCHFNRLYFR
ncbi:hypothetical protein STEG23_002784 [Scotinomys teguina]